MKNIAQYLSICLLTVVLSFSTSFAQSPGAIDVENNTNCAISVTVFLYSGASCPPACTGTPDTHGGTAAANTTTTIHTGTSLNGQWGKISMDTGNKKEEAGPCVTSSSDGCDCNGADIKIEMDNCNLAIISLE